MSDKVENQMSAADQAVQKFTYLLNAVENAAQSDEPYTDGYPAKRRALMEFVAALASSRAPEGACATITGDPEYCPHGVKMHGGFACGNCEAAHAHSEGVDGWVRVEDELPEPGVIVHVYQLCEFATWTGTKWLAVDRCGNHNHLVWKPEYWTKATPLPAPPKEP